MPELASPVRYNLQPQVFQPISPSSYFNRDLPVQPAIPADKAAKAQSFGAMMKVLGELPGHLMKEYDTGKKRGVSAEVAKKFQSALGGTAGEGDPQLSDFSVGPDGSITFKPEDPELAKAKLEYYKHKGDPKPTTPKPSPFDKEKSTFGGDDTGTPNPALPDKSPADPDLSDPFGNLPSAPGQPNPLLPERPEGTPDLVPGAASGEVIPGIPAPESHQIIPGIPSTPEEEAESLRQYREKKGLNPDGTPKEVAPGTTQVSPEQRDRIAQASQYVAGQLTNLTLDNLGAGEVVPTAQVNPANGSLSEMTAPELEEKTVMAPEFAAGNDAPTKTVGPNGKPLLTPTPTPGAPGTPEVRKAQPVAGRTVNHITGEVYLRSENGTVKTYDPITETITLQTPDGRKFQMLPQDRNYKEVIEPGTKPSALLLREAAQMGIDTDGKTNGQIAQAMAESEKANGIIRPSRLPVAQSLARLVLNHPTLKHYPTIREAKEAIDAGLANQDTGGFGDMALVEGFQRMVNPGATVRSQTMQQMLKGAGLGQYTDLGFLMDHFKEGDKFNPETRQRLAKLANDIFARATANAKPQLTGLKKLARSYGINEPDDFIDNVLNMTHLLGVSGEPVPEGAGGAPAAPGAAAAPAAAPGGAAGSTKENPIMVNTPEAYTAAPSGAWVSDGKKIGKKP